MIGVQAGTRNEAEPSSYTGTVPRISHDLPRARPADLVGVGHARIAVVIGHDPQPLDRAARHVPQPRAGVDVVQVHQGVVAGRVDAVGNAPAASRVGRSGIGSKKSNFGIDQQAAACCRTRRPGKCPRATLRRVGRRDQKYFSLKG